MPVILPLVLQSVWPACLPFRPPQGLAGCPQAPDRCPPPQPSFFDPLRATESSYLPAAFVPQCLFFYASHLCSRFSHTDFHPPLFSLCAHLHEPIYLADTGRLSELSAQLFSLFFCFAVGHFTVWRLLLLYHWHWLKNWLNSLQRGVK